MDRLVDWEDVPALRRLTAEELAEYREYWHRHGELYDLARTDVGRAHVDNLLEHIAVLEDELEVRDKQHAEVIVLLNQGCAKKLDAVAGHVRKLLETNVHGDEWHLMMSIRHSARRWLEDYAKYKTAY